MLSDCEYTTLGAAVGVLKCHFGDWLVVYIRCGSSIAIYTYILIYKYTQVSYATKWSIYIHYQKVTLLLGCEVVYK